MPRFCDECCQERDDTSWSDNFNRRLCIDCFNLICEAIDNAEGPDPMRGVEFPFVEMN